jgi:hypothetical protein
MTATEALVTCDYCAAPRPVAQVYRPYPGAVRCRDEAACKQRQVYAGSHAEPPARTAPAAVSGAGPCAICGASAPDRGLFERTPGVAICVDRPGCDERAIEHQYLHSHGDDGQVLYTSAQMRAVAAASVRQVAADMPAEVTEARQAAARADYAFSLAAAGRRR